MKMAESEERINKKMDESDEKMDRILKLMESEFGADNSKADDRNLVFKDTSSHHNDKSEK